MTDQRPTDDSAHGFDTVYGRGAQFFRRWLMLGVLAAIALLVATGAFIAWQQYDEGKQRALREMRTRVVLAASVFDTYYAGQLATLNSVAAAPAVVREDTPEMAVYFARLQGGKQRLLFTGGLGWVDRAGRSRVSDTNPQGSGLSVTDRSYFKSVISTGKPYISEGLVALTGERRIVVMAVPTRDSRGRISGVLAGAMELRVSATNSRTIDLGYDGLVIIDRAGQQVTLASFARPRNQALLSRLKKGDGLVPDTRGLDGSTGRAVAFANAAAPGWIVVIERPRSIVFASARRSLVLELASIAAAALIVALIVGWAIVRSRRELDAERTQMRNWDALSQSLGEASAAAEVSQALGTALASSFPEARVIIAVQAEDARTTRIWTFGPEGGAPLADNDPRAVAIGRLAIESDTPIRIADGSALNALLDAPDDTLATQSGSLYAVPLGNAGARGSASVLSPAEQPLDDTAEAIIDAHVGNAGRALARARRHEREHDAARELQRSLLPDTLPTVDGLRLAGRYSAGGVGLEVGGDWYDAVRRPDGILHLTVGDVAGKGIEAAVLMGQLRNAFRALAYEQVSPAELGRRLTRLVPEGAMATAVFLSLDPFTGELRYTSAGHPPALLLDGVSGETSWLDGASSPPLGWIEPETMVDVQLTLRSNTTLLAYTDGLVERRGESIDEGIARVTDLLRERPDLGVEAASSRLLEHAVAPLSATDDVALLMVQVTEVPATMSIEIPSEPSTMRVVRSRLKQWLARRGIDEEHQTDTILAVSEACNNAIEHAYRQGQGTIRLTLEHRDDALRIAIEDRGTWQAPDPDPTRGRGMMIMRGTMDTVEVASNDDGTRVQLELRLPADRSA